MVPKVLGNGHKKLILKHVLIEGVLNEEYENIEHGGWKRSNNT